MLFRSEFANIVSHDLRTPLTVASGNLELARQETDSDYHDDIADAMNRMEQIIDDTLTMAREGEAVVETEPVDIRDLAQDCWDSVAMDGATLTADEKLTVEGDPTRLKHIFENLFRNAVEHGGSSVTVGVTDDGFYVADDGPGLPDTGAENLFESGYSTRADGTGFGLAIVEEIVQAHGWEISALESESGGARFEVTGVERHEQTSV